MERAFSCSMRQKTKLAFHSHPRRKEGCRLPMTGAVAILDMASGQMEKIATGRERKRNASGLYDLVEHFKKSDVAVVDRAFYSYELICLLGQRGAHSLMRLHQKREVKLDWRAGRRLDVDRTVRWAISPPPSS